MANGTDVDVPYWGVSSQGYCLTIKHSSTAVNFARWGDCKAPRESKHLKVSAWTPSLVLASTATVWSRV